MRLKRAISVWAVGSVLTFIGLYLYHRYVEKEARPQSVRQAAEEYVSGMRWLTRRVLVSSREMKASRE
ncbi:MAG: hypothetical protein ABEJ27_01400 [Halodesulfurarchaeum sp.]